MRRGSISAHWWLPLGPKHSGTHWSYSLLRNYIDGRNLNARVHWRKCKWWITHCREDNSTLVFSWTEKARSYPDTEGLWDSQEINDVCDQRITTTDVEKGRGSESRIPYILDLHPECKCIIVVQKSCQQSTTELVRLRPKRNLKANRCWPIGYKTATSFKFIIHRHEW